MNRILVTGGVGFIGSSLVDALLQSGNEVAVFDHFSKDSQGNLSNWSANQNFKLVYGDMLDRSSLMNVVDSCNTVFHLAANSDVRIGANDTKLDYEQNILATYNLLEAMKNSNSTQCKKIMFRRMVKKFIITRYHYRRRLKIWSILASVLNALVFRLVFEAL
ncbi:MAG TPA: GDP-mannose 4,6-dehydratase [Nitrososphaeraceae archaeon]|nr:GDP-mannose 4,6-dehydratase [Nitrososphaeraceae archaeon]